MGLSDAALRRIAEKANEDTSELEKGIEIEHEHADAYQKIKDYYEKHGEWPDAEQVYEWIASDHIDKEDAHYYSEILIPAEEAAKNS